MFCSEVSVPLYLYYSCPGCGRILSERIPSDIQVYGLLELDASVRVHPYLSSLGCGRTVSEECVAEWTAERGRRACLGDASSWERRRTSTCPPDVVLRPDPPANRPLLLTQILVEIFKSNVYLQ